MAKPFPEPKKRKMATASSSSVIRTRTMGAVERLGQRSGPTPEAELHRSNLNRANAGSRRGQFYERASSRQSRTKEALERNGSISRDVAVPLGGNRCGSNSSKHKRPAFHPEDMDAMVEQRGRERFMNISLANGSRRPSLQQGINSEATGTAAASAKKSNVTKPPSLRKKETKNAATKVTKLHGNSKISGKTNASKGPKTHIKKKNVPRKRATT